MKNKKKGSKWYKKNTSILHSSNSSFHVKNASNNLFFGVKSEENGNKTLTQTDEPSKWEKEFAKEIADKGFFFLKDPISKMVLKPAGTADDGLMIEGKLSFLAMHGLRLLEY